MTGPPGKEYKYQTPGVGSLQGVPRRLKGLRSTPVSRAGPRLFAREGAGPRGRGQRRGVLSTSTSRLRALTLPSAGFCLPGASLASLQEPGLGSLISSLQASLAHTRRDPRGALSISGEGSAVRYRGLDGLDHLSSYGRTASQVFGYSRDVAALTFSQSDPSFRFDTTSYAADLRVGFQTGTERHRRLRHPGCVARQGMAVRAGVVFIARSRQPGGSARGAFEGGKP